MPHSEIHGSKGARPSPRLFAACHVLHRLSVPRHPPNALTRLIRCASAAHREQTPRMRASTPRLILSTSFYPPGRCPGSLAARAPAQARQSLANGQSHSYPQCQRPDLRDQASGIRGSLYPSPTRSLACPSERAPSDARCLSCGIRLVEPTGIEPVTPCLQSRCSPS